MKELLNLGCGPRTHDDWVNVDFVASGPGVLVHDLSRGLPFPDRSFRAVYHSHVLEHFPKEGALSFVKECYRVLKPGGRIRVVVPDLEGMARRYLESLDDALQGKPGGDANYDWMAIEVLDQMVRGVPGGEMAKYLQREDLTNEAFVADRIGSDIRDGLLKARHDSPMSLRSLKNRFVGLRDGVMGLALGKGYEAFRLGRFRMSGEVHQWMYDRYSLARLLKACGFSDPEVKSATSSGIQDFERFGLDLYKGVPRGTSSLFMEAVRSR
jgi:predicted SAM-dependent methyltransferase